MTFPIIYEKINQEDFPEGFYYAHIPSLQLTTHGKGIDGAKNAALDLIKLWLDEKHANNEKVSEPDEFLMSTLEI